MSSAPRAFSDDRNQPSTAGQLTTPVPRDRWGRPLVVPPEGGAPVAYTRCTTYVSCLEDTHGLALWQQRMVALGLADRPDLLLAVSAHRDDTRRLNEITAQARDAAAAGAAATTGTALHALTERIDRGQPLGAVPAAYQADLDAYRQATAGLEVLAVEQFVVCDPLRVGGTLDRLVRVAGRVYVADIKTGDITHAAGKIAMQLAVYAHSVPYDHATRQRTPRPWPVETDRGLVIHLPAGTGQCQLWWVDLAAGWEAVQLARQVRAWRARRDLLTPADDLAPAAAPNATDAALATALQQITAATSVDALRVAYATAVAAGADAQVVLDACLRRKAELEGAA